ncbi:BnaC03g75330D [Brassica napus]|uniref:BnaC03g75330D protein n=1 Tax=Brassica napus TaxID=3708 RepID=A0A078HXZ8_BRANA|nr:BnaC03g75330D [Brassica napus]
MSSKRKSSTKSRRDRSVPEGSSSHHVGVVPKVEISAESIDPEEVDAWRTAMGEVKPPTSVVWVPPSFKPNHSGEFRLPESGEVALSPPEGYFTCYEAQVNPCGLQHLVWILVLSYELGITLDADHLEAWVEPQWSRSLIVQVRPRTNMAIISGFVSKYHFWKEHFFLVRVSDASVEASAIPIFRTRWGTKGIPNSEWIASCLGIIAWTSVLLGGIFPEAGSSCCWALPFPVSAGYADQRRIRFSPDNILKDYLVSQAGGSEEGSDFSKAARMVNGGLLMINRALDTSRQEAQMDRFRAEVADKEIARLKDDLESSRRHGRESFAKEVNHAYKRGKREIVEVMKSHRDKFSQSFEELKGCYKAFTDYRDCRGTVGGLYLTQHPDYSFSSEYAKQTGLMAEKDKDPKISEVEDEIWKQWEPVPVSPDTVEAETGGLD